jgi:hypothetical protein
VQELEDGGCMHRFQDVLIFTSLTKRLQFSLTDAFGMAAPDAVIFRERIKSFGAQK